ncbi:hypothetical protein [uncultured Lacinutrix sp.]|uniref:hypothetical protein n=1 Tax=uncultured Lacinutrix sp. TaxID=574032 RepID=UPI00262642F3|nr:hypothetical protein [uncultured Lacinutrix sp.]
MLKKWYISALVVILTIIGISQEQAIVPNQEIVLQFSNSHVSSNETQEAIDSVRNQLQDIGIQNVNVKEEQKGRLVIAYYSTKDVASIKEAFFKDNTIGLGLDYTGLDKNTKDSEQPSNKNPNHYNLDIYEIQKGGDLGLGFGGKYVFELKQEYVRFYNPNVFLFATIIDSNEKDSTIKVAYIINRDIALAIDNTSYKIPEVRAGPIC